MRSTISNLLSIVSHLYISIRKCLNVMFKESKRLTMIEHIGQTQHKIEDVGDMVDRISNLPDCILHHILSFMCTKEAVKTSILSTRWKNLWAFVPNIDIDDNELLCDNEVDDVASFVNFVERVLRSRDASNIQKFSLHFNVFRNASKIHSWISYAIMHNVQELDLVFSVERSMIPRAMFDSTSLVILRLRMRGVIELPSHVSFPCLKTLHLSTVRFANDDFTEKLLSGCPVLQELIFCESCSWNLKNIAISSSTLKSLTIHDMSHRVEFDDPTDHTFKIDAANLTYFRYIGYLSNEIIFNDISSLDKASINIPILPMRPNKVAARAIDPLLKQLRFVVSLRLYVYNVLEYFADDIRVCFPVFPNLTHLLLDTETWMNRTCRIVMALLSSCPVLQSICFPVGLIDPFRHCEENNSIWSTIPICISNCLKTVTYKKFHGSNSEICFIKCVLKHARLLERMHIRWSETYLLDLERKTQVRNELEKIERSSTACVIELI